jgi:hypothetical protein
VHIPLEKSPDPESSALIEFKFVRVGELDEDEIVREVENVGQGNVSALTLGGDMSVLTSLNATRTFNNTNASGFNTNTNLLSGIQTDQNFTKKGQNANI